jgi:hypothetical protein
MISKGPPHRDYGDVAMVGLSYCQVRKMARTVAQRRVLTLNA